MIRNPVFEQKSFKNCFALKIMDEKKKKSKV